MNRPEKTPLGGEETNFLAMTAAGRLNNGMESPHHLPEPANDAAPPAPSYYRTLLVKVGRNQDRQAFAELFDYYAPRIKSFLIKGGANPDQADELAQETMVTVWQKAPSFDPAKAQASTWIFTIARNKRIDALRRKARPEIDMDDAEMIADGTPSVQDNIMQQQETDIMADALKSLPQEQSALLYKSFFEDKTHADIARESNLPLGTVKSRIRLALEKLRGDQQVTRLWQQ